MPILAVIPARYGSTRLPAKALLDRTGKPLVVHVAKAVRACATIDRVVVATDDQRIVDAVTAHGGEVVMTSAAHRSGTDRVAEVAELEAYRGFDTIINVQGDEPELDADVLPALIAALASGDDERRMATLATPFGPDDDADDPAAVKVVIGANGCALYFSRARIPYDRVADAPSAGTHYRHVGIYGFTRPALIAFTSWPPTPLEQRESLEQLRALEHGLPIRVGLVANAPKGIDTPADYDAFVERMRE